MAYRGIENPYNAQLLWRQVSHNCYPHDTEQRLTLSEPWWPLAVAHLGMFVTLLSDGFMQESSSYASSQSCSASSVALQNGEFAYGDGGGPALGKLQRRCSSLPTGTVIKHLPCSSRPHHSSASKLDTLEHQDSNVLIHLLLEKVSDCAMQACQPARLRLQTKQCSV